MVVLIALAWALGIVVTLILLVLCIPYVLSARATAGAEAGYAFEVRPISARFPLKLGVQRPFGAGAKPEPAPPEAPKPKRDKPPKRRRHRAQKRRGTAKRVGRAIRAFPRLLRRLLGVFTLDRLEVQGTLGLDDPADTGILFGVVTPLNHIPLGEKIDIALHPSFDGARLEGICAFSIRVVPVLLIWPFLAFGWTVLVGRS